MISTTEVSSFRLGHAASHARPSEMMTAHSEAGLRPPTRIRHLCSGMKDSVSRMLGAMGLAGHFNPPAITSPVPHHSGAPLHSPVRFDQDKAHEHHQHDEQDKEEGHDHGVMVKFRPVPAMTRPTEEGKMEEHHRVHHHHHAGAMHHWKHHKGAFLQRIHRALMSLGPWEGRAMAFVLGESFMVILSTTASIPQSLDLYLNIHLCFLTPPSHSVYRVLIFLRSCVLRGVL